MNAPHLKTLLTAGVLALTSLPSFATTLVVRRSGVVIGADPLITEFSVRDHRQL